MTILIGCGSNEAHSTASEKTVYASGTSVGDCYLCGDGLETLIPSCLGQNNVARISFNTFDVRPVEINRYDRATGEMSEEYAGFISFGGGGSKNGEFSASMMIEHNCRSIEKLTFGDNQL